VSDLAGLLRGTTDPAAFARSYLAYVGELLGRLDAAAVGAFIEEVEAARTGGHTVFIAGNGGSAATASHMATDFGFGTRCGAGSPFRAHALTDNVALLTAIGNDEGYEHVFVHQLRIHYRSGDSLVCISASGSSPNVLAAAAWVRARGGRVISLVGFDGGALKGMSDVVVHVATARGEYGPVEDAHLVVNHLVTAWLMHRARGGAQA
jgi:D-sedoheptulose 7-phosphate isomerase